MSKPNDVRELVRLAIIAAVSAVVVAMTVIVAGEAYIEKRSQNTLVVASSTPPSAA